MLITIDIPSEVIFENDTQLTFYQANEMQNLAQIIVKVAMLTMGNGKTTNVGGYDLVYQKDNRSCKIKFDLLNLNEDMFEKDLMEAIRAKLGLIKTMIIDPIALNNNADIHWKKNIGMSFQNITQLKDAIRPLSRLLIKNKVFAANKNDNFGDIQPSILDDLPQNEIGKADIIELSSVEIINIYMRKKKISFENLTAGKDEQKTYHVVIDEKQFIDIVNTTKYELLYDIAIEARKTITGAYKGCFLKSYKESDSYIVIHNNDKKQVVSKRQANLL
ncbi:MAG: hypothetical protein ABF260_07670 [Flavobacteriaceae bacterium]